MSNSSMSTIIKEEENVNSNLSTAASPKNHNTGGLEVKLNLFFKKISNIQLTQIFCQSFYRKTLSRGGQKPNLSQPQEILTKTLLMIGIPILKQISIVLEKQIAAYCDKTEGKTHNETKTVLKQKLKKSELRRCKEHCNIQ